MPDIQVTKTVTRTSRTRIVIDVDELEQFLREKFELPDNTAFHWRTRYDEFDHLEIVHETTEMESEDAS
jgi:hypothetical protein